MVNVIPNSNPVNFRGNEKTIVNSLRSNNSPNVLATTMPSERQSLMGIVHPEQTIGTNGSYEKWKRSKLFNPKQAPSAVTTENFLKSKSDFSPVYVHNIALTKKAFTSVIMSGKPRYPEKVDLLA
tara:strand:- start:643 stop:1017 length:375 start_codon:yes stop_codon:yes gene_type:complete